MICTQIEVNAPLFFNPIPDPTPWESFSPLHNIDTDAPPVVIFLGDSDKLIPVSTCERFCESIADTGGLSRLHIYENQSHGFFNWHQRPMFEATVTHMDAFLTELGYLLPLQ